MHAQEIKIRQRINNEQTLKPQVEKWPKSTLSNIAPLKCSLSQSHPPSIHFGGQKKNCFCMAMEANFSFFSFFFIFFTFLTPGMETLSRIRRQITKRILYVTSVQH